MDELKDVVIYMGLGILAILGRLLLALERITVYSFLRAAVTGALVGVALGTGFVENSDLDPMYKYLVFGVAVSLAEDFIAGILNVGKQWRTDPQSVIRLFRRK